VFNAEKSHPSATFPEKSSPARWCCAALAQNAAAMWQELSKTNKINGKLAMLNEEIK
jgi:hypothetical protein